MLRKLVLIIVVVAILAAAALWVLTIPASIPADALP